eukprot:888407_1
MPITPKENMYDQYGLNIEYALSEEEIKQCIFRNISYENITYRSTVDKLLEWSTLPSNRNKHCVIISKAFELGLFLIQPQRMRVVDPKTFDSFIGDVNGNIESIKINRTITYTIPA